ncbi:MAG: GAF domain-containing sensor histidine kinase [Opitutales bacterium]|nr:GAF domain-containing sensor histidine kinase [Opitutales bacterium]
MSSVHNAPTLDKASTAAVEANLETHVRRLLQAVVEGTARLVAARDVASGLPAMLATLGEITGLDRVYVIRYDHAEKGGFFLAEYCAPGVPTIQASVGLGPHTYADYEEVWRPLMEGKVYTAPIQDKSGENRTLNLQTRTKSDLFVPVFVHDVFWGALGFDDCARARIYCEAEIDVLRGAATALAATLSRDAAEQGRHDEKTRAVNMLSSIVTSSRELIEAEDFEAGVLRWLGHFGRAAGADRATLFDFCTHEESGLPTWRMFKEWVRQGVANSISVSFEHPYVIDPRGDEQNLASRMDQKLVVVQTESAVGKTRECLDHQGIATIIALPFSVANSPWGAIGLDFLTRRDPSEADLAVLRTAADTFATVLKSRQANEAAIREREARLAAAERDNRILRRHEALLEAVSHTSRIFLRNPNYMDVLPEAFARIAAAIDIHRVVYFAECPAADGRMAHHVRHEWNAPGMLSHAETDLNVIYNELAPSFVSRLHNGYPVWSTFDEYHEAIKTAWVLLEVKSNGCVPIMVHGHYHGAITFNDCLNQRTWSEAEIATLSTAANALASAIERQIYEERARAEAEAKIAERKRAEADRREAVLAERTRLAGVIHDTLAQGFVGVLLQLEAAEEARQRGREANAEGQTEKARELARFGLTEARRSALAIRPLGGEHDALEQALQSLAERVFIAGRLRCDFERKGEPRHLPGAHAEALLSIANEGINNALRHGGASHIRICLKHNADSVELCIRDNGRWRQPERANSGLGLPSMRENITHLQGCLAIETGKNGTTLRATLPVSRHP